MVDTTLDGEFWRGKYFEQVRKYDDLERWHKELQEASDSTFLRSEEYRREVVKLQYKLGELNMKLGGK